MSGLFARSAEQGMLSLRMRHSITQPTSGELRFVTGQAVEQTMEERRVDALQQMPIFGGIQAQVLSFC
jgi:hypothetical protein